MDMSGWFLPALTGLLWGASLGLNFLARPRERRIRDGLIAGTLFCLVGPAMLGLLGGVAQGLLGGSSAGTAGPATASAWGSVAFGVVVLSFLASFVHLGQRSERVARVLMGLQTIDRRLIYLAVALLVFLPLVLPFDLPMYITPAAQSFYDTVEKIPLDKLVIVSCDYDAGVRGENEPQTRAVIEHLMKKGQRFAIMGFSLQGPEFAQRLAEKAEKKYNRTYGRDWCNWGYKPFQAMDMTLMALAKNIPDTIQEDRNGTRLRKLEVMKGIETIQDVGMICEFTGSGMLQPYIRLIQGVYGTPLAQGCTGIIGPEQYPYLDSGQLQGLLVGMKGAAEYENLVGYRGKGRQAMIPQSTAHILLMGLIVLGNIGLYITQRRER